jgi:hypothetical protein
MCAVCPALPCPALTCRAGVVVEPHRAHQAAHAASDISTRSGGVPGATGHDPAHLGHPGGPGRWVRAALHGGQESLEDCVAGYAEHMLFQPCFGQASHHLALAYLSHLSATQQLCHADSHCKWSFLPETALFFESLVVRKPTQQGCRAVPRLQRHTPARCPVVRCVLWAVPRTSASRRGEARRVAKQCVAPQPHHCWRHGRVRERGRRVCLVRSSLGMATGDAKSLQTDGSVRCTCMSMHGRQTVCSAQCVAER